MIEKKTTEKTVLRTTDQLSISKQELFVWYKMVDFFDLDLTTFFFCFFVVVVNINNLNLDFFRFVFFSISIQ